MSKPAKLIDLYTEQGKNLSDIPWDVYPRPQMKRESYLCLNGKWDFTVTDTTESPVSYDKQILVPFCPESLLSGVHERFDESKTLWYKRTFTVPTGFIKNRLLLHFGAVDQLAKVYLNGTLLGEHVGGYDPFTFDITDVLAEENTLVVQVQDHLSNYKLPYGKQCQNRGGMWYTPVSGIWQTVWLESVPDQYIHGIKIQCTCNSVIITSDQDGTVTVFSPEGEFSYPLHNGVCTVTFDAPRMWSPEDPYLYNFKLETEKDCVSSYFALRTITSETIDGIPRLCLNGKPYFFHGLLDQGYWSDGLFTPASPQCFADDIMAMKALGFNMLRKHIKIEPEQFYYDCDRLGMIVFQDMVNNGAYSFIRDTALPTVGIQKRNDKKLHKDAETRKNFEEAMVKTVNQLYNHPSVCYWTIFNEGWGQFCGSEMYKKLKQIDSSRIVDTASGWFKGCLSDVVSPHVYFRKLKCKAETKPLVLSEFGGYSWKPENHVANTEQTYGYKQFTDREEFVTALQELYTDQVLPLIKKGLCGAVYTQVSDVEDETNGILSYDRAYQKVKPEEFLHISKALTDSL